MVFTSRVKRSYTQKEPKKQEEDYKKILDTVEKCYEDTFINNGSMEGKLQFKENFENETFQRNDYKLVAGSIESDKYSVPSKGEKIKYQGDDRLKDFPTENNQADPTETTIRDYFVGKMDNEGNSVEDDNDKSIGKSGIIVTDMYTASIKPHIKNIRTILLEKLFTNPESPNITEKEATEILREMASSSSREGRGERWNGQFIKKDALFKRGPPDENDYSNIPWVLVDPNDELDEQGLISIIVKNKKTDENDVAPVTAEPEKQNQIRTAASPASGGWKKENS